MISTRRTIVVALVIAAIATAAWMLGRHLAMVPSTAEQADLDWYVRKAAQRRSGMRGAEFSAMVVGGFFWLAFVGAANAAPVTVTGCLEKGHERGEFQLSHATGGGAEQYELIAGKGVDLNAHLGHKVEIT